MAVHWPNLLGVVNPGLDAVPELGEAFETLPGWVVFHRSMARDAVAFRGDDFSAFRQAGMGVIVCLEWNSRQGGTIPPPEDVSDFASRCRAYVEASPDCHVWVIGNEMNCALHWPQLHAPAAADAVAEGPLQVLEPRYTPERHPVLHGGTRPGNFPDLRPIAPAEYAYCYGVARATIRELPGHQDDLVLTGAVAPWNDDAKDASNTSGDWVQYFRALAEHIPPGQCDGFALHTATRGPDPDRIRKAVQLPFPFGSCHADFHCVHDFIAAIPPQHQPLPVFITEASQLQPWHNAQDGWIVEASALVLRHNRTSGHTPIRCLALYQWDRNSPWTLRDQDQLLEEFNTALAMLEIRRRQDELLPVSWEPVKVPEYVEPGATLQLSLHFTNIGDEVLYRSGDSPIRLLYRCVPADPAKSREAMDEGVRLSLPHDVDRGEACTLNLELTVPDDTGPYELHVGLVKSQFVWSSAVMVHALRIPFQVREYEEVETYGEREEPEEERALAEETQPEETSQALTPEPEDVPKPETESDFLPELQLEPEMDVHVEEDQPEPELSPLTPVPIHDLRGFLPQTGEAETGDALEAIARVVLVETGVAADMPLDELHEHFIQQNLPGVPFHYMIADTGDVFLLHPPLAVVYPYAVNFRSALAIGLEGKSTSPDEARDKLQRAADACATILASLSAAGLPLDLELGIDTLDGRLAFQSFVKPRVADWAAQVAELWWEMVEAEEKPVLTEVFLPVEGRPTVPEPSLVVEHAEPETPEVTPFPREETLPVPPPVDPSPPDPPPVEEPEEPEPEPELEPEFPTTIPEHQETAEQLLDLKSQAWLDIGQTHTDREGVTIWATGEDGTLPYRQLKRIHALKLEDFLYHYLIDGEGRVYDTKRKMQPDEHLSAPHVRTVHIGLRGVYGAQSPTNIQIQRCGELVARLAQNARLLDLNHEASNPGSPKGLFLGSENGTGGSAWWQRILDETRVQFTRQQYPTEPESPSHEFGETTLEQPEPATEEVDLPSPTEVEEPLPVVPASPTAGIQAPHIVDKVGSLPHHPNMHQPRRELEAIRMICLHHSDAPGHVGPERLAQSLVLDQNDSDEPQTGLPYHYFVHPDGQIDQCRDLRDVCMSLSENNEGVVSVCLAGKFTQAQNPTQDQLEQTAQLLAWLVPSHFLASQDIRAHRDVDPAETVCPGEEWDRGRNWKATLFHYIQQNMQGTNVAS